MKALNKNTLTIVGITLLAVWALNKYDSDILAGKSSFF